MNLAIWKKAVSDAWLHLAISATILVLFSWVFIWLMSQLPIHVFGRVLKWLPDWIEPLLGVPLAHLGSPAGVLSLLFIHMVTMMVCVGWAVGRGSDSISGEIARGTMDLILSLPVWRVTVMAAPAVVATLGAIVLAAAVLLGIHLGLATIEFGDDVSVGVFLPGAINLSCMIFCLTGVTTFMSSWNRSRWRTIALAVGFFLVSEIVEMVGRVWQWGSWLIYGSFLTAFQPQRLILEPEKTGLLAPWYNGTLLMLGLVAYAAAAIILARRDIPAAR